MWSLRLTFYDQRTDVCTPMESSLFCEKISWKKYPAKLDFETNFRYELENNAFL